jgi:hypothetical protein
METDSLIRTKVTREEGFVRFTCEGKASVEGYRSVADCIRAEMAFPEARRKVFVDVQGVEGEITELGKFSVGEYIAKVLLGLRIGVLMSPKTALTKFGENTAVNRGAYLFVSHDEDEVLAWLEAGQLG